MKISIGIFAYNEEQRIGRLLADLAKQTIFSEKRYQVAVYILANGCVDDTVEAARRAVNGMAVDVGDMFSVHDLQIKGKSRTWNHFVHEIVQASSEYLIFIDGDIRIPCEDNLERMVERAETTSALVVNSNPRKDIEFVQGNLSFVEKMILSAGGSAYNFKSAICGQLYLVRAETLQNIYMPIGLPVEDGFLRAMIVTNLLTEEGVEGRIEGDESIWHIYDSIREIRGLIKHQTRIIIGSAINTAIFDFMVDNGDSFEQRAEVLRLASKDEQWLHRITRVSLPRWPYGYVPFHFLVKRLQNNFSRTKRITAKNLVITMTGFFFDSLVYVIATIKMAGGRGAGYW